MKPITLLLLLLLMTACLYGQEQAQFQSANEAYSEQNYKQAISEYEAILSQGLTSKELHFNLANALYEDDQLGKAILHYEKALRITPSDKKVKENLAIATDDVELEVLEVPPFFLLRFWRGFSNVFSSTVWVVLQFICGILMLMGIFLWRIPGKSDKQLSGFKLVAICLPLLLLSYSAGATASKYEQDSGEGIIISSSAMLEKPQDGGELLEELTPGVKVILLDKVDLWYKVSLINKEQGWVKVENIGLI